MIACSFGIAVVILIQFIAEPVVGLFTYVQSCRRCRAAISARLHLGQLLCRRAVCRSYEFLRLRQAVDSFLHNSLSILLVRVPGA